MKRKLRTLIAVLFVAASAAIAQTTDTFDISSGKWTTGDDASNNCTWSDPVLTVNDGANITLTGTASGRRVEVNGRASMTLDNVTITSPNSSSAITISSNAKVIITPNGTNNLTGVDGAGILTVGNAELRINGSGTLTARGGYHFPGIGRYATSSGQGKATIIIDSGTITASGGDGAAAIGGGGYNSAGTIIINGGTINATGGNYGGAGIGSGFGSQYDGRYDGDDGTITINGGTITATGGRHSGAGIGSGQSATVLSSGTISNTITITINGGTVTAYGSFAGIHSPAIGSGSETHGSSMIRITGGVVTATAYGNAAAIGNGSTITPTAVPSSTTIVISGGMITATGGNGSDDPADIGHGGANTPIAEVTIAGGSVNATRKKVDNPKDSDGLPVYLSTLTVGNVGNNISLTGMNVNGFPYDVNDVKTDGSGKVYCWLPAVSVRPEVQVSSTYYGLTYTPNADNNNTQTLPQLSSTVALISVVQTGGQLSTKNSTGIRLTFGSAVPWLLISDLFLRDDTGAAVKGASLTDHGGGTSWTLSLADVTTQGTILVGVRGNASIGITGTPQPVEVYKGISAPTTSGVIITPAAVKVQKGFTQAFTAVVQGGVGVPQTVVWSVTDEAGNTLGSGTTINAFSGLLTVSANEPLNVLHVVATSTAGHTVSGRAVVSLYAQSSLPGSGGEVTTPPGGDPIPDEDGGGVSLPGGGEFTDPVDGSEYDLPPGTVIDGDGNITTGDGDGTVVTDEGGRIDIPGDTHITPDGDDAGHTVVEPGPDGATVTYPDGSQVEVPGDGSIIIIDPSAPGGLRIECPVRFALAPGVSVDPAGEVNYVPMGRNFDFTLTPPSRDLAFTVTTGRIINGVPEKLLGHLNVDGTYTYTVREVRQAVVVTVATYLNVGNEKISSGHRVWTEGNRLFVDVAKPTTVSIYTVTGKLYSIRKVPAGQTSFVLEGPGIYVVEIDGSISKLRTSIN